MSKDIILKTGEFSSRSVNRSKSELSDVSKTMETIKAELYAAYYDCGATHKRIFSASTIEAVGKGCNTAHSAWIRLGRIAQFLDDGPEKLLAVDRSTKSKSINAWDRFTNSLGGGFGVVIGGVSSFWNNLFGKSKNKTGNTVVINPYGYLADRFDWSETTASQTNIDTAINEAKKDAKGGESTETAILARLNQLYEKKKKCGVMVKSSTHEGYYTLNGCDDYIKKQPYSGPCCAFSYAMGLSLIDNKDYDPWKYWNGNEAYNMGRCSVQSLDIQGILEQLKQGKPVLLHCTYDKGQHWVLICGTKNTDPDTASFDDLLVMDPGNGQVRSFTDIKEDPYYKGWKPNQARYYDMGNQ